MKAIPVGKGLVALVDDEDFERIAAHAWHVSHNGYAIRRVRLPDGRKIALYMHHAVHARTAGLDVDHRDRNKLNNCRANLRDATRGMNNANAKPRAGCSSTFKGVAWHRNYRRWWAYIDLDGKRTSLGYFTTRPRRLGHTTPQPRRRSASSLASIPSEPEHHMPVNGFSVGKDYSLSVIGPQGPIVFNLITGFQKKQDQVDQKIKGLDGISRHVRFVDGWTGSFSIERRDSTLDDYFAQQEINYYAGATEGPCSITETISETNGSITQWRYTNVLLSYDDAGEARGDATIKQRVRFVAARRLKVT